MSYSAVAISFLAEGQMACKECVYKAEILIPGKFVFWCTQSGETRQFEVDTLNSTVAKAHGALCQIYNLEFEWNKAQIVHKPSATSCLHVDMNVVLKGGSTKRAGDIRAGDEVLGCALEGTELVARQVLALWYDYDVELLELTNSAGSSIVTSREQPVITSSGPVKSRYVFREATVFTLDQKLVRRSEARFSKRSALRECGNVVSLDLGDEYCFFAGRSVDWWMVGCHKPGMDYGAEKM
jgi:hypothetical protein